MGGSRIGLWGARPPYLAEKEADFPQKRRRWWKPPSPHRAKSPSRGDGSPVFRNELMAVRFRFLCSLVSGPFPRKQAQHCGECGCR